MSWASEEFISLDLGDERLNKRAVNLLEDLGGDSVGSLSSACAGWKETKAAYRFFDNPKATKEAVLTPHKAATLDRMKSEDTVLLVQDTT